MARPKPKEAIENGVHWVVGLAQPRADHRRDRACGAVDERQLGSCLTSSNLDSHPTWCGSMKPPRRTLSRPIREGYHGARPEATQSTVFPTADPPFSRRPAIEAGGHSTGETNRAGCECRNRWTRQASLKLPRSTKMSTTENVFSLMNNVLL